MSSSAHHPPTRSPIRALPGPTASARLPGTVSADLRSRRGRRGGGRQRPKSPWASWSGHRTPSRARRRPGNPARPGSSGPSPGSTPCTATPRLTEGSPRSGSRWSTCSYTKRLPWLFPLRTCWPGNGLPPEDHVRPSAEPRSLEVSLQPRTGPAQGGLAAPAPVRRAELAARRCRRRYPGEELGLLGRAGDPDPLEPGTEPHVSVDIAGLLMEVQECPAATRKVAA